VTEQGSKRPAATWRGWLRAAATPRAVADVLVVAGLWLLLAGSWHLQEVAAALLVGLVAGGIGVVLREEVGHRPVTLAGPLRTTGRLYLGALRDCWTLTRALLASPVGRSPAGRVRRVPFDVGTHSGADVGRRVVATVGTSLQPNTYVVGFDRERDLVLVHELVASGEDPVDPPLAGR
jgi:multisubunit Na+/H+ antiporter MnhE subunit